MFERTLVVERGKKWWWLGVGWGGDHNISRNGAILAGGPQDDCDQRLIA